MFAFLETQSSDFGASIPNLNTSYEVLIQRPCYDEEGLVTSANHLPSSQNYHFLKSSSDKHGFCDSSHKLSHGIGTTKLLSSVPEGDQERVSSIKHIKRTWIHGPKPDLIKYPTVGDKAIINEDGSIMEFSFEEVQNTQKGEPAIKYATEGTCLQAKHRVPLSLRGIVPTHTKGRSSRQSVQGQNSTGDSLLLRPKLAFGAYDSDVSCSPKCLTVSPSAVRQCSMPSDVSCSQ